MSSRSVDDVLCSNPFVRMDGHVSVSVAVCLWLTIDNLTTADSASWMGGAIPGVTFLAVSAELYSGDGVIFDNAMPSISLTEFSTC